MVSFAISELHLHIRHDLQCFRDVPLERSDDGDLTECTIPDNHPRVDHLSKNLYLEIPSFVGKDEGNMDFFGPVFLGRGGTGGASSNMAGHCACGSSS